MVRDGPARTESEAGLAEDNVNLEQMLDLATPWCLRAAATLRIPRHIASGHREIGELAAVTGCDPDALHALLGYLVSKGVFREESPGRFACNRAAEQLAEAGRFLDLEGIGGRMAHAWGTVLDYVRTGQPAYQKVFGRPFWEDLAAHPAIAATVLYYGTGDPDQAPGSSPVLGHFAESDPYEEAAWVTAFEQRLRDAGRKTVFHHYAGTGHWFAEPSRDAYRHEAAELAFERTLGFLERHLRGA